MTHSADDIAIVGMASHFPEAPSLFDFWTNIIQKKDAITDIDMMDRDEYWSKSDFFDANPLAPDKTYGYRAGFVPPIDFNPIEFKLPPLMLESISTAQIFALYVARQAVRDAGLVGAQASRINKDRVGVILGGAGNGNTSFSLAARQQAPFLHKIMVNSGLPAHVADDIIHRVKDLYLEWNEDSFPGFLGNVACGRIASYFDFGGTSYMVDAACASSLAAVKAAVGELRDKSCDAVITGGVNLENSVFSFLCFSKTPALSKVNQSRPFDESADGMMLGDGVGFLVLRRLEDARRDGDRIYAVIKSIQASSDGRAKSIFAPRYEGQVKAMSRAYERSGVSPKDIQLVEAHGTGTQSGDKTEIRSLSTVFREAGASEGSVAIGSIKSQIGHTRCAAGAASMMKVALGLYHKVLPATINVEKPSKDLLIEGSPFYVNADNRPWFKPKNGKPRYAALSAFGFGGTNFHAVLEEYEQDPSVQFRFNQRPEVVTLQAVSPEALLLNAEKLISEWQSSDCQLSFQKYQCRSDALNVDIDSARIAFVAEGVQQARLLLIEGVKKLQKCSHESWEHPLGIYYKPGGKSIEGRVVALFPGQGSQYVNMGKEVVNDHPIMRKTIEELNDICEELGHGSISDVIYPHSVFGKEAINRAAQELIKTKNAQPAIGALSAAYFQFLKSIGFKPDFTAGHSYGEVTALWAAGVLQNSDFYRISLARGHAMEEQISADDRDHGLMLAISASRQQAEECLSKFKELVFANDNSPQQVVIGGSSLLIRQAHAELIAQQINCQILPVAAAFHTNMVSQACQPFYDSLKNIKFSSPQCNVYSCFTGAVYHSNEAQIKESLAKQIASPVKFRQMIEAIYRQGGYLFVEIGPKGILGRLVGEILKGREHRVVSLNPAATGDSVVSLHRALAQLFVEGIALSRIDPDVLPIPVSDAAQHGMKYRMTGGFFLSSRARQKRKHALRPRETGAAELIMNTHSADRQVDKKSIEVISEDEFDENVNSMVSDVLSNSDLIGESVMKHEHEEMKSLSTLDAQISAQNLLSQVHQQFQTNQSEYIQLLNSLMSKQCDLLEKFQGDAQLSEVVRSLNQSFQLLDKNQSLYHLNHEQYFENQQALLSGGGSKSYERSGRIQKKSAGDLDQIGHEVVKNNPALKLQGAETKQELGQAVNKKMPKLDENIASDFNYRDQRGIVKSEDLNHRRKSSYPAGIEIEANEAGGHNEARDAELKDIRSSASEESLREKADSSLILESVKTEDQSKTGLAEQSVNHKISEEDIALLKRMKAFTENDLVAKITEIVGERTGYPVDMINDDMDLEADLGIDSIKRLEIFGAMFDQISINASSFQDAEQLKETETFDIGEFSNIRKMASFFKKTINDLADRLEHGNLEPSTASDSEKSDAILKTETHPEDDMPIAVSSREEKKDHIPKKDTKFRRLGVMASTSQLSAAGHQDQELISKKSSAELEEKASASVQHFISSDAIENNSKNPHGNGIRKIASNSNVNRYEIGAWVLPRVDRRALNFSREKVWLIVDDGGETGKEMIHRLLGESHRVIRLILPWGNIKNEHENTFEVSDVQSFRAQDLCEHSLRKVVDDIKEIYLKIGGSICILPEMKRDCKCEYISTDIEHVRVVFTLAKYFKGMLSNADQDKSIWMLATRIDGALGISDKLNNSWITAGLPALTKSLNIEWDSTFCRTVDIHPNVDASVAASFLYEELCDSQTEMGEVGRGLNGERLNLRVMPTFENRRHDLEDAISSQKSSLNAESIVLVTGGARGITAECVIALAKEYPARFVLLGRTDINAPLPSWAFLTDDAESLKTAALTYLQQQGEVPTPVKIDQMVNAVLHVAEIRKTISRVECEGAQVKYVKCDIGDINNVEIAIREVEEEWGFVTDFIHGAGNLADKRIEKKSEQDFRSVFHTKVLGLLNVISALDNSKLHRLFLFSSVSGFFGNAGQTDYALANEALNKFAWQYQLKHPRTQVCAINWGPWDTGMVSPTLRKIYQDKNLVVVPTAVGVDYFINEFLNGCSNGLNALGVPQILIGGCNYKPRTRVKNLPPITEIERELIASENLFLKDHMIGGNAVLPATMALGWMVQACEDILPGYRLESISNFKVLKGIVLEASSPLQFTTEVLPINGRTAQGDVHILNVRIYSHGLSGNKLMRYQAEVFMRGDKFDTEKISKFDLRKHIRDWPEVTSTQSLYGSMRHGAVLFHGSAFRGIKNFVRGCEQGAYANCYLQDVSIWKQGLFRVNSFNPYLGDVFIQAPIAWLMLSNHKIGLPSTIGSWEQFLPLEFNQEFSVTTLVKELTMTGLTSDIIVHDSDGVIFSRVSNIHYTISSKLREMLCGVSDKRIKHSLKKSTSVAYTG